MPALAGKSFSERLPDQVEIRNAEQFRQIVATQVKDRNEPTKLSLTVNDNNAGTVVLLPALRGIAAGGIAPDFKRSRVLYDPGRSAVDHPTGR